ncbi:MAG: hypothetical protein KDD38_10135, partial [Bdellovibrionales bacterium]|nr:hypothetical protein [Bdellovibrionales bacterium]
MSKTECLKSIKFITLLLFASFNLYAQITLAECLPKNRIKSDIEAYVEKAQGTLKNLDLLQSDIGALEVSPKLLFTIDFNDSESVERRVVELTKLLKSKGAQREPFRTWQACLGGGEQELVLKAIQVENEVNLARLRFLELPEEKRQNLIKIIADAEQQRQILSEINQKNQAAQTQIEQAQENISMAENVAAKSDDMYVKQLSADWALLEKYKEDLASIQIAESKKQKERMDRYQEIREELANTSVAKVADLPEVKAQFESSTKIWRRMVDNVYELLSGNALPKVPALPEKVLIKSEAHDEVTQKILDDYLKSYAEAEQNRAKLEASLNEISRKEKEVVSRLLLKSGGVRAELFQKAIELEGGYSFSITNENVSDLGREIQVIPFRPIAFFISKSVEFKQKLASGFDGWVNIIQQLIVFSGVIFIPFGLFFILNGISAFIDRWRKNLISKSTIDYRTRTNLVIWLNRLNPYFPLVAMLLATKLADQILQKSDLAELGFFVPYLELYFFYRIFRRALSQGLSVLFIRGDLSALKQKQVRVQDTATKITRLFFAELAILYLTEDAVRQAIMYTLTSKIIFYVNIIFIIYILNQWKVEIQSLAERVLPKVAKQYIHSIYSHKYSYILNPVVFILAAAQLSIQILYKWLSRFDFMKRFSAELFRKKLEDHTLGGQSEARDFTLPDNYKEFFNISKPVPEGAWVNLSKTTLTD